MWSDEGENQCTTNYINQTNLLVACAVALARQVKHTPKSPLAFSLACTQRGLKSLQNMNDILIVGSPLCT